MNRTPRCLAARPTEPGAEATVSSQTREPDSSTGADEAALAGELVARIRAGDRSAESAFVEAYSRGLLFYLKHRCGDAALADDLHQEAFKIVLQRLRGKGIDDPTRVVGFLRRTAKNLLIAGHRKAARRQTRNDEEVVQAMPDRSPDPLSLSLLKESVEMVRSVIAELPNERDRRLLYRFYVAEDEKDEICEALEIAPSHMKRVLFRARQRFKDKLNQLEDRFRRRSGNDPAPNASFNASTARQSREAS